MKKRWLFGAAMALIAFVVAPASAQNPKCTDRDDLCVDTNDGNAGAGNPLVDVTSELPVQGLIAVGQDPGYVVFDGDATNPDPLDGYIGLNVADEGLIFSDQGNHARRGGNVRLLPAADGGGMPELPLPDGGGLPALPLPAPGAPPDLGPPVGLPLP